MTLLALAPGCRQTPIAPRTDESVALFHAEALLNYTRLPCWNTLVLVSTAVCALVRRNCFALIADTVHQFSLLIVMIKQEQPGPERKLRTSQFVMCPACCTLLPTP